MPRKHNPKAFDKWLHRLCARLRYIIRNARRTKVKHLRREASICESMVDQLYEHSAVFGIDMRKYNQLFIDINEQIWHLQGIINVKSQPWWKRVFTRILHFLRLGGPPALPPPK